MKTIQSFIRLIMPFAVITVVFLTIFAAVQQSIRQGANETPVQIAGDMADLLQGGAPLSAVASDIGKLRKVDLARSISPFVAVYDASGTPVASSGALDGKPFALPQGVFAYVANQGESRVTLEPQAGTRIASDIRTFDQSAYGQGRGYVVSGKNLREAEDRIHKIGMIVLLGWLASLFGWAVRDIVKSRA